MDSFKHVGGGGCLATSIACLCILACFGGAITFVVYLGMYAFANPNAAAWYGETIDGIIITPGLYDDPTKVSTPVDIHGQFVTWFLWGFAQTVLPIEIAILFSICSLISQNLG